MISGIFNHKNFYRLIGEHDYTCEIEHKGKFDFRAEWVERLINNRRDCPRDGLRLCNRHYNKLKRDPLGLSDDYFNSYVDTYEASIEMKFRLKTPRKQDAKKHIKAILNSLWRPEWDFYFRGKDAFNSSVSRLQMKVKQPKFVKHGG